MLKGVITTFIWESNDVGREREMDKNRRWAENNKWGRKNGGDG